MKGSSPPFALTLSLLCLGACPPAIASPKAASGSLPSLVDRFELSAGLHAGTPGFALLVTMRGKTVFERYQGLASLSPARPVLPTTPFRLASVTKPFTALATLQLAEQGLLRLSNPVSLHLPEFPWPEISIHHLLTHTSGLPEYTSFSFRHPHPTNHDVLRTLKHRSLAFPPGTASRYSNSNYAVLAVLIETLSAKPFPDVLHHRIFQPAGMTHTSLPALAWSQVPDRAIGYRRTIGWFRPQDSDSLNGITGAIGIYASASDLDRWLTALHTPRLCLPSTLKIAFRPEQPTPDSLPYGYGWLVTRFAGERVFWHNGNWLGFDAFIARLESQKANVIILSNFGYRGRKTDLADDLGFPIVEQLIRDRSY